jgi:hypothetical protein
MVCRKSEIPQLLMLGQDRTERVGFEPTVRLPVQRFSSSKTIFALTILPFDALCHAVSRGWFAIWFANFSPSHPA